MASSRFYAADTATGIVTVFYNDGDFVLALRAYPKTLEIEERPTAVYAKKVHKGGQLTKS